MKTFGLAFEDWSIILSVSSSLEERCNEFFKIEHLRSESQGCDFVFFTLSVRLRSPRHRSGFLRLIHAVNIQACRFYASDYSTYLVLDRFACYLTEML